MTSPAHEARTPPVGDPRAALARAQAGLVRALLGVDEAPPGFDPARIAAAARALRAKRARVVRRAFPAVAAALGARFDPWFRAYAEGAPPPPGGSARTDLRAFVAAVLARPDLTRPTARAVVRAAALHLGRFAACTRERVAVALRVPRLGVVAAVLHR